MIAQGAIGRQGLPVLLLGPDVRRTREIGRAAESIAAKIIPGIKLLYGCVSPEGEFAQITH